MFSTGRTTSADLASQATTDLTLADGNISRLPIRFSRKRNTGIFRRAADGAYCIVVDGVIQMYATSSLMHINTYITSARSGLGTGNTVYGALAGNTTMTGNYNSYYGYRAGISTTTGSRNVLIGYNAGDNLTSGLDNVAIGADVAPALTTGNYNVLLSTNAGQSLTTGTDCIFIGREAGAATTTTSGNVFIGAECGRSNVGSCNLAIGYQCMSLDGLASASNNLAIGNESMYNVGLSSECISIGYRTMGSFGHIYRNTRRSISIGVDAGYNQDQCEDNICIGTRAAYNTTNGSYSIYIGTYAGCNITGNTNGGAGGDRNIAIGIRALQGSGDNLPYRNIAIGEDSLYSAQNAVHQCIAIGRYTGSNLSSADGSIIMGTNSCCNSSSTTSSVIIGYSSCPSMSGNSNTIIGANAGYHLSNSTENVAIGNFAMGGDFFSSLTAEALYNTCVGAYAGAQLRNDPAVDAVLGVTTARYCTFIGWKAGSNCSTGYAITGIGIQAGYSASGKRCTYLGTGCGYQVSGNSNVFIGYDAGYYETSLSDTLIIANSATTADELIRGTFSSTLTSRQLTVNGNLSNKATFVLDGNLSNSAGHGRRFDLSATTFEDTSTAGSGTASWFSSMKVDQVTVAATNASVTTTNAASLYIENAPVAGTNQTLTNTYALYVNSGDTKLGGDVSVTGALTATSLSGSITPSVTFVSSTPYSVLTTDENLLVDCTSSAITVNLPNISSTPQLLRVKDQLGGAGSSNITVNCDGSDTIDGGITVVLSANYASVTLVSDGVSKWSIV